MDELTSDGSASFTFTQGSINCTPPKGFETYFGPAPHYRFVSYDGIADAEDHLEKIRNFPEGSNAEDVMREIFPEGAGAASASIQRALDGVYRTLEEEGPFDGIIGYSEGATVASTLILDEKRREAEEGRERMIKCGIFFAGWPPIVRLLFYGLFCEHFANTRPQLPGKGKPVLVDDSEELIDVPTCHVIGAGDPYLHGSMALYNVCDEDSAAFFDHGKGHTLPRDQRTLKELGNVVRDLISQTSGSGLSSPRSPEY